MLDHLIIRPCKESDLDLLEKELPSPSLLNHHLDRFRKQKQGQFTYLIAWLDNKPVGTIFINWKEIDLKKLKGLLHNKPHIAGAEVKSSLQSQGIGTKLIHEAEEIVKKRGYKYTSIAVETKNSRARNLYEKLGYKDLGIKSIRISWTIINKDGKKGRHFETVNYLTKRLSYNTFRHI